MANSKPWLSNYPAGMPTEYEYEKTTMPASLTRVANKYPQNNALLFMGKKITYGELETLVNQFARALTDLGVKKGDKVAVHLPNIPQVVITNYAALKIGAVLVMVNPLYTERELEYQFNDSDARVLVSLDILMPRVFNIKDKTKLESIVCCHLNDYLAFPKKQLLPLLKKDLYNKITPQEGIYLFKDLITRYSSEPVEDQSSWDELAALLYTGGTTGVSKGVMLNHSHFSCGIQNTKLMALPVTEPGEKVLAIFPFFHAAGFTQIQGFGIWEGVTLSLIPRPSAELIVDEIKKIKPNYLPGVPTIWVQLLENKDFCTMDLSFVKGFLSGAAPLSLDIINRMKELRDVDMVSGYGLTETTSLATVTPWGDEKVKPGTVGLPMQNIDCKIMDLEVGTKEMPQGETGEIIFKGPIVTEGYYNKEEETRENIRDGWLYTGDIGYFDDDWYLYVVDRKKDMVIAGGYNVYPVEVDDILYQHPKVLEACSVGVPDQYRGETLKAFIVVREGETLTEQELIDFCKEKLAAYKVPRQVEFVDELPKTAVGKILRRKLREQELEKTSKQDSQ